MLSYSLRLGVLREWHANGLRLGLTDTPRDVEARIARYWPQSTPEEVSRLVRDLLTPVPHVSATAARRLREARNSARCAE